MKRILLTVLSILVCVSTGFASSSPVYAFDQPNGNPSDQVSFSSVGMEADYPLQGPYDSLTLKFNLPPEWKLLPGADMEISLTKYFSSLVIGQSSQMPQGLVAGNLDIIFNGIPLQTTLLQDNGDVTISVPVSEDSLQPDPITGMHELTLQWDASASCDLNLATSLVIHPDSTINFPHDTVDLDLDLAWWPAPVYLENSPDIAGVTLVIPDQPTQIDLQTALAVAAGLGRVSQNKLKLALTPIGQLPSEKRDKDNLIMIGKLDSLDNFKEIDPSKIGAEESDGIIQMTVSPWNERRVVVAVTGGNDEGLLMAGDALNNGTLITSARKNVAIVQGIKNLASAGSYLEDVSFANLTTEELTFQSFGTSQKKIPFTLPADIAVGADSYIDLVFNHSQLIDYLRSGIVVKINDLPVGSVRLSDATSGVNMIRLIVPPASVHAGLNTLGIQVDLIPRTICTDPRRESLWVTIFTDSLLHLPIGDQTTVQTPAENLGQYPWPLANNLANSAIILPSNNPPSWYVAARLAYDLGGKSGAPGYPEVLFAESVPGTTLAEKNILVIGRPADLPQMAEFNKFFPGPFDANNELTAEVGARINYRITQDQSVGYLELAQSSSSGKTIYAVLGSSGEGIQWAGNALVTQGYLQKLAAGNLAIIQGNKLTVENITPAQLGSMITPASEATPQVTPASPGEVTRNKHEGWILPAMIVSILLILILVGLDALIAYQKRTK